MKRLLSSMVTVLATSSDGSTRTVSFTVSVLPQAQPAATPSAAVAPQIEDGRRWEETPRFAPDPTFGFEGRLFTLPITPFTVPARRKTRPVSQRARL